jgi:hypothetical protein
MIEHLLGIDMGKPNAKLFREGMILAKRKTRSSY